MHMLESLPDVKKPNIDCVQTIRTTKIFKSEGRSNEEPQRFLIELSLPKVKLSYKQHQIEWTIPFTDLNHLVLTNFRQWKAYVIWTFFRLELNITSNIPHKVLSPKQAETWSIDNECVDERDEDNYTETSSDYNDYGKRYPPKNTEINDLEMT